MNIKIKFISILIIINIISITAGNIFTVSKAENIKQTVSTDINAIDDRIYPGIKSKISELKKQYPNWNFKILYTGIKWEDAIKYEYTGHGSSPKNLVPISPNYSGNWICSICKNEIYDSGAWKCASEEAVKYMMDPRNSMNTSDIFQFLELSYDQNKGYSKDTVKNMLKGTFLEDEKYADTIISACMQYNVNPYYIVARILQEQGKTGTTLTKGEGYNGQYVGYYNIFNIGACGSGTEKVILNGLAKAKNNEWTSLEKSIIGGIQIIASQYIARGQNTMYLQKFDVDNTDGNMYWHQYMQNILAAQSEGEILKKTLSTINAVAGEYTFIIPVYENMPSTVSPRPSTTSSNVEVSTDLVIVNVNSSLKIRSAPAGTTIVGYLYAGEIATRIQKATEKVNGTYWDKVLSFSGVEGYVARSTFDGDSVYKLYLVPLSDEILLDGSEENNNEGNGTTGNDIKQDDVKGNDTNQDNAKGDDFIKGDVNGDGKITTRDAQYIQEYVIENRKFTDLQKKNADVNGDGEITTRDAQYIQEYVIGNRNF